VRLGERRQKPPQLTDEQYRRYLAGRLVAARIFLGVKPGDVLDKFGISYKKAALKEKLGLTRAKWEVYRLAVLENELHDAYLSTLQRYARAIGAELRPRIVQSSPGRLQRLKMNRVRRNGALKRKTLHKTRRVAGK
jgi:hypothetical protein